MNKIETAIILAAGLGERLKPITNELPKCLAEVKGNPILMHTLEALERNGIKETVIVVGHLGEKVINEAGTLLDNMKITYIWNKDFGSTNSIYSLWLAREYLKKGSLIIEGDCIFEDKIIKELLHETHKSYWAGSRFTENNEGCMLTINEKGKIVKIGIIREKLPEYEKYFFKSAGLLKITDEGGKLISEFLDNEIKENNTKIYYDLALAKNIDKVDIDIFDTKKSKWYEIDTIQDLRNAEHMFQEIKYVVLVIDGAADITVKSLNNKTPLEYAKIPKLHELAKKGMGLMIQTSFEGLPVGSIVAGLGILGYNPYRYYPNGRASFEAMAQGLFLEDSDICFRCNLISIKDSKIKDFTAGMISTKDAINIIDNLDFDNEKIELYSGQSYRNILLLRNTNVFAGEVKAYEPHMNVGKHIDDILLKSLSEKAKKQVDMLNKLMNSSVTKIKLLNKKYNTKADMLWLWSPSAAVKLPSFAKKHNLSGSIIAGLDFMRGIGEAASMVTKEIHGATGYIDTNLKEKLKYTKNYLRNNDFVLVHINMADEAAHMKDAKLKVKCIERVHDEFLIPLLDFLNDKYKNKYRLAVLPDHYTLIKDGTHQPMNVPCIIYGAGIKSDICGKFTEKEVQQKASRTIKSYELMNLLTGQELS